MKTVLSQIDVSTLVGIRDYLLIRLIFFTGDVKQIISLKWDQPLPGSFSKAVTKYKSLLENYDETGYLFFNLDKNNSKHLSLSGARRILTKYAVKAGFDEKFVDFQALKRLRAKQIYEQTDSIEAVQAFCGHKSKKATRAFIKTLGN